MTKHTRESLLRAVEEHISEAIFTVDRKGTITSWNRGAEQLLGYTEEQIVGSSCSVINGTTCLGSSCREDGLHCPLFAGGVHGRRCVVRHRDGRKIAVLKNGRLLRDEQGQVLGGVETLTDVSSLLTKEEAQRLDRFPDRVPGSAGTGAGGAQLPDMVGRSPAMEQLRRLADQAAGSDVAVLIQGESGTGKEVLARAIHARAASADAPFVHVDCVALSESLLESELFGHARGAFTGAVGARPGRFELADGGTLFLDEVGDIPPAVQKKLLRFLQSREFERVGENVTRRVNVRVISATLRDLRALVSQGEFREDLFWRLSAFPIELPPLRERVGDVPLLAEHFLSRHWRRNRSTEPPLLGGDTRRILNCHDWPGNCRELENVMWYAATVAERGAVRPAHLPPYLRPRPAERRAEADELLEALERCRWNRSQAAALLGISRSTLWRRMQRLGIDEKRSLDA